MRGNIRVSLVFGALTSVATIAAAYASPGRELLFSAPIQQLDHAADTVTVLSQVFHTAADQLSVGEIVNVYGVLNKDGSVADAVVEGTQSFGTNGDPVFVKGMVTDTDTILGRAEIDGMTIDYTPQLANPDFVTPAVGDVIAVAASQPIQKGVLVATATGNNAYAAGMSGGGVNSAGMSGGGINSAGMSGGGINSAGMSGGGINSAGMSGGGVNSAGMSGGGINSAGMSGGGVNSAGMSGGGINSAGMSGGGVNSAGMSGGGINSAQVSGGGRR